MGQGLVQVRTGTCLLASPARALCPLGRLQARPGGPGHVPSVGRAFRSCSAGAAAWPPPQPPSGPCLDLQGPWPQAQREASSPAFLGQEDKSQPGRLPGASSEREKMPS